MTKLAVCPIDYRNFKKLIHSDVNAFIVGIKDFNVFIPYEVNINKLKELLKLTNKEIFIAINKPIYNSNLNKLRFILKELSKLNIKGILFEDISVVNINNELNLNLNLVWNQMHFPTNYYSCNYWYKKGIQYALLSTELRLQDYIDIKKNSNIKIITYMYGYLPIFESSRTLITNYLKYINKHQKGPFYIYEEQRNKHYPIYEKNNETFILDDILNGIKEVSELKNNNIDYIVINGLMHKEKNFNIVVDCFIKALNGNNDINELNNKININNTGFLYKETIYKVKL